MRVLELTNPEVLMIPDVQALIKRAMEAVPFAAPGGFDSIAKDVYEMVVEPSYFVLAGAEDGHFHSLVIGFYPSNAIFPFPTIMLVFNDGSPTLMKETKKALFDLLFSKGYTRAWAMNATDKSDETWLRCFRHPGVKGHQVASVIEFMVD